MKTIEISDEAFRVLQQLSSEHRRAPGELLNALFSSPPNSSDKAEPLAAFVLSESFRCLATPEEKYLALLAWIATRHPADFSEYIRGLESGRRFLGWSREAVLDACRQHHARQIANTPYWAVMNLEADTRRRFVARLLDFVGYSEAVADVVCAAIGLLRNRHASHRLVA